MWSDWHARINSRVLAWKQPPNALAGELAGSAARNELMPQKEPVLALPWVDQGTDFMDPCSARSYCPALPAGECYELALWAGNIHSWHCPAGAMQSLQHFAVFTGKFLFLHFIQGVSASGAGINVTWRPNTSTVAIKEVMPLSAAYSWHRKAFRECKGCVTMPRLSVTMPRLKQDAVSCLRLSGTLWGLIKDPLFCGRMESTECSWQ